MMAGPNYSAPCITAALACSRPAKCCMARTSSRPTSRSPSPSASICIPASPPACSRITARCCCAPRAARVFACGPKGADPCRGERLFRPCRAPARRADRALRAPGRPATCEMGRYRGSEPRGLAPMTRVLLTGGAGYIASHTAIALAERGHEVVLLDNFANAERDVPARLQRLTGKEIAADRGRYPRRIGRDRRLRDSSGGCRHPFRGAESGGRERGRPAALLRHEYYRHDPAAAGDAGARRGADRLLLLRHRLRPAGCLANS